METQTKKFIQSVEKSLRPRRLRNPVERNGCVFLNVLPADLVPACQACLSQGAVFDSAFVSAAGRPASGFTLYYLLRAPALARMLVLRSSGTAFAALSAGVNAALWDERKIQDLTGLHLEGIPDERPLIFHPESGLPRTRPVGGKIIAVPKPSPGSSLTPEGQPYVPYPVAGTGAHGEFEVAVGPVHAGIIEPGHFRFHVIGEKILKMETRMFYLHRGIEQHAEGRSAASLLPLIEQISGDETVANSVAFCHAVERAMGIPAPPRAESIRAIYMELERIYSHLADLGGMPTDVGFTLSASRFAALREDMMRLNARISGSRFLRSQVIVGGVSNDLDPSRRMAIKKALLLFLHALEHVERLTFSSSTFLDRVFMTGAVSARTSRELSLVGPAARASGVSSDLRRALPYGAYVRQPVREPLEQNGDVLSRFYVKLAEVKESAHLALHMVNYLHAGPIRHGASGAPASVALHGRPASSRARSSASSKGKTLLGVGWAEAPRGGCTFLVELSPGGTVRRLCCRTASFRNWRAAERAVENNLVPDFPLINKSFNLSYAGTDL